MAHSIMLPGVTGHSVMTNAPLGRDDIEAAVIGGCILGGGGGGAPVTGLARARAASALGPLVLHDPSSFPAQSLCATVAIVGAPTASAAAIDTAALSRSLLMLRDRCPGLVAINSNENGAETTLNGWAQSVICDLPLLDLACNGRAHPTGLMGAMGLHRDPHYRALQAFASNGAAAIEGVVEGSIENAAAMASHSAIVAGGVVSVARNPVTIGFAMERGAPGAISYAIALGRTYLNHGIAGLASEAGLDVVGQGTISDLYRERRLGLDVGRFRLIGDEMADIRFINEYISVVYGKDRFLFPDLIMVFDGNGPVPSSALVEGQDVIVTVIAGNRLPLSPTMHMPELYVSIRTILGPNESSLDIQDQSFSPLASYQPSMS